MNEPDATTPESENSEQPINAEQAQSQDCDRAKLDSTNGESTQSDSGSADCTQQDSVQDNSTSADLGEADFERFDDEFSRSNLAPRSGGSHLYGAPKNDQSDKINEMFSFVGEFEEQEREEQQHEREQQRESEASSGQRPWRSESQEMGETYESNPRDNPSPVLHNGERLQKVMAQAGLGSRRSCELYIEAGRVRVNGEIARLGRRVTPDVDLITLDGAPVSTREGLAYYLLNKPAGVVTTSDDELGRESVVDFVPSSPRVHPVGRLDRDSEGLILLTNDGELAHRITHPSFGVEKQYLVLVAGSPSPGAIRSLREGVEIGDGITSPAKVSAIEPNLFEITIHEGPNRQVRRMFDAIGHRVIRLARTRVGNISDTQLPQGRWRPLTNDEVIGLSRLVRTTRAMRRSEEFGPAEHNDGVEESNFETGVNDFESEHNEEN